MITPLPESLRNIAAQTTTFSVDGEPVLYTTVPCQHVTHSIDNVITLPLLDAPTAWGMQDLIPARTLAPGVHALTWTSTFLSDYSYSLGCTDPSGRCSYEGRHRREVDYESDDHRLTA